MVDGWIGEWEGLGGELLNTGTASHVEGFQRSPSLAEANRVYWRRERRAEYREARVLVDAPDDAPDEAWAQIDGILAALEAEPSVSLITVAASGDRLRQLEGRLREEPPLLPVNTMRRQGNDPVEAARELGCGWTFVLDSRWRELDLLDLGRVAAAPGQVRLARGGRIQPG